MEIELTLKLGDSVIAKVRGDSQREVIDMASFFSELPAACPVCQARVLFTSRHPQGYDYYGMRCAGKPSHETTFGMHKDGGTLYYKANEPWTAWSPASRVDEPDEETAVARLEPVPSRATSTRGAPARRDGRAYGR